MSILPAGQESNMLTALEGMSVADWRVSSMQAIEAQDARAHLTDCITAFTMLPSEDRLRNLNNAWMRAKRALRVTHREPA